MEEGERSQLQRLQNIDDPRQLHHNICLLYMYIYIYIHTHRYQLINIQISQTATDTSNNNNRKVWLFVILG